MDMGCFRIFHDARNDQVMMSIEVSFIYTFFFPVNVGCVRVCLGLIILFISFIFQNIVLFSSFYCNKLKISICMGFLKLVLGLNTA